MLQPESQGRVGGAPPQNDSRKHLQVQRPGLNHTHQFPPRPAGLARPESNSTRLPTRGQRTSLSQGCRDPSSGPRESSANQSRLIKHHPGPSFLPLLRDLRWDASPLRASVSASERRPDPVILYLQSSLPAGFPASSEGCSWTHS